MPVISETTLSPPNFRMIECAGSRLCCIHNQYENHTKNVNLACTVFLHEFLIPMCENQTMDKTTQKFIDWIFTSLDKKSGKTQSGLAEKLGVAHPQMSMLKAGKRDLKVREIPVIAEYLEKSPPSWDSEFFEPAHSGENLKVALTAYGVHEDDLTRIVKIIDGFVDDVDDDERERSSRDQSEPASRPHDVAPKGKRVPQSSS